MKKIILLLTVCVFTFIELTAQVSQTVKGTVIDKESQVALPGASVIIAGTDSLISCMTNSEGNFRIDNIPVGRYNIVFSYLGYKSYTAPEILVKSGKQTIINVEMTESVVKVDAIEVVGSAKGQVRNSMATVSARTFSVEDTRRYAGSLDDPARMASSFAGVATAGNMQDNAIVIRGNAPKGILWKLEGVEISNPNHFPDANIAGGGFVTIFSSQLVGNSDFFTGAFPAEYGNALAGVFDMRLRIGNNEKREHTFQAGIIGLDFASEGPFVKGKKASYLFNYRYSTFSLLTALKLIPSEQIPRFQDLSFKLNFPTKRTGTFSLWGIGGYDQNTEPTVFDSIQWESDWDRIQYDMKTHIVATGLSHKLILGNRTYINSTLSASGDFNDTFFKRVSDELILEDNQLLKSSNYKYSLTSFINHKFSRKLTNRTGVIIDNINYDTKIKFAYGNIPPMTTIIDEKGNDFLLRAYSQFKYNFSSNLFVNAGVHSQYFLLNDNYTVEPRLALSWNFSKKHTINVGYGNHSQLEPINLYLIQKEINGEKVYPNHDLDFAKSHHFVLGYDFFITKNMRLKIEPYYQKLYNTPVVDSSYYSMINFVQDWAFDKSLTNKGSGENIGIELTLEKFFNNGYYFLATGSFFDSKYTDGDGIERNTRYNRGVVANGLFGKEFTFGKNKRNILGVNGKVVYMNGLKMSPIDLQSSIQSQNTVYDYSRAYEEQEPNNLFFDFTITYRRNKPKYSSVWALQIKNVFGANNYYEKTYNPKTQQVEESNMKLVIPAISYKIEF